MLTTSFVWNISPQSAFYDKHLFLIVIFKPGNHHERRYSVQFINLINIYNLDINSRHPVFSSVTSIHDSPSSYFCEWSQKRNIRAETFAQLHRSLLYGCDLFLICRCGSYIMCQIGVLVYIFSEVRKLGACQILLSATPAAWGPPPQPLRMIASQGMIILVKPAKWCSYP